MRYGALLGSNLSLINKVVGLLVGPALGHYWFITSGKEKKKTFSHYAEFELIT